MSVIPQALAFIVFVEIPSTGSMVRCYRDSEHTVWEEAVTRLRAVGKLAWIESAHSLPFKLLATKYLEQPKPEEKETAENV